MKNERKKVEEKGVKKREKWEDFEGEKWEKCPRGYAPSIARYLKNEFLEVLDLLIMCASRKFFESSTCADEFARSVIMITACRHDF